MRGGGGGGKKPKPTAGCTVDVTSRNWIPFPDEKFVNPALTVVCTIGEAKAAAAMVAEAFVGELTVRV